ncbi:dTDP-4-dehydrorhamnose 3,5-epimerase [Streptomyces lunaelactis]|uniref:dTDP-4-dehydrorhamnose 3,5-epimerase n=1 Tax=Streptomyces lunaelactis TaxID=1535768 RepID=A0A2R4T790_9ACTN|nr:dTDP-4-dehydrorhamnose 3,5-epimerase [Streptomyces lunaelactis]AVZ75015.1 dTDP-4-dehydrorhamnose 3,5-epimerase [Streptomyces lunaelactis]NUK84407.1 dTDP-4-dehydrorhamnose 3,5-epimerase family protein [Streptomyces lunaelactis]
MRPLGIEGAWVDTPEVFADGRGRFHEWFKSDRFRDVTGQGLHLGQANCSRSVRGTLRGIHYASVPPGQAKYVTCVSGAVLDVVVDIRTGSPTFGTWEAVQLDDTAHRGVYLSEGLGHAFMALDDHATVVYLCSQGYAPQREYGIHPFDPTLAIAWPEDLAPRLSEKDVAAPTLREAERQGLLPSYEDCGAYRRSLRVRA